MEVYKNRTVSKRLSQKISDLFKKIQTTVLLLKISKQLLSKSERNKATLQCAFLK